MKSLVTLCLLFSFSTFASIQEDFQKTLKLLNKYLPEGNYRGAAYKQKANGKWVKWDDKECEIYVTASKRELDYRISVSILSYNPQLYYQTASFEFGIALFGARPMLKMEENSGAISVEVNSLLGLSEVSIGKSKLFLKVWNKERRYLSEVFCSGIKLLSKNYLKDKDIVEYEGP
ncbi:MAG: hypothetical protein AB7I27_11790 [Bacteriovoracaceae bacterium]